MKRIIMMLTRALAVAAMILALAVPAFAQGPEGGNPGLGNPMQQGRTVGANDLQPLPFGGQTEEVLPGGNTAGLNAAAGAVVCTAPGSPFYAPDLSPPC
jgi:hypothetical protein